MHLVGNDWLHLTQNSQYMMDRFLDTTLSGGSGDQYDPTHSRPLGYYDQTDLPYYYELATQFATSDTWYSPDSGEHRSQPNVSVRRDLVRSRLPAPQPQRSGVAASDDFPRADRTPASPGATTTRTTACSWPNWADWNDPQIQGNVRNIQEYYNILASPNADQNLPQVVFIERASAERTG